MACGDDGENLQVDRRGAVVGEKNACGRLAEGAAVALESNDNFALNADHSNTDVSLLRDRLK
jgi:hypothetical protein